MTHDNKSKYGTMRHLVIYIFYEFQLNHAHCGFIASVDQQQLFALYLNKSICYSFPSEARDDALATAPRGEKLFQVQLRKIQC